MRKSLYIFAIAFIASVCSSPAFADVKVKSKQTISGQSYESATFIKGKRQRSESMGGMISIMQCDLKRSVQLNSNSKTYMVNPFAPTTQTTSKPGTAVVDKDGVVQTGGRVTMTFSTKDTGERKQMFGHTARHLIITMESVSSPDACSKVNTKMQTDGWYIDAAFALDCDYGGGYQGFTNNRAGGCQDKYEVKTLGTAKRGYPVYEKTTMFDENGKETYTMINEVLEFSQATLDPSLFEVPGDYREVSDAAQMYAGAGSFNPSKSTDNAGTSKDSSPESGLASSINNASKTPEAAAPQLGPKKAGVTRIGISTVRTGAVGEGIKAADLSAAIQNTFIKYLKLPNVEVVSLETMIESAVDSEARSKECDFVIFANASHKKGGGGFGMFKSIAPVLSSVVPMAGAGSAAGHVAGTVASHAIITAASVSSQVKNKDEITLDLKLNKTGGTPALAKVFKTKAKSDGDDIISQIVEQAAQAIVAAIGQA